MNDHQFNQLIAALWTISHTVDRIDKKLDVLTLEKLQDKDDPTRQYVIIS
jgi:hypothetical protein